MKREVTIRLKPPSPELERQLIAVLRREYRINDLIRQRLDGESYFYAQLESKDAHP